MPDFGGDADQGARSLPCGPDGAPIAKGEPKPLYVWRKLLNADEVIKWAKAQGFKTTLPADQMHVTVTYSKDPVDWMAMGNAYAWDGDDGKLTVASGGPREVSQFNQGAVVLQFACSELSFRNLWMREQGASYDWQVYSPHVTLSYNAEGMDLSKVEPYRGKLIFGPEIFEEIKNGGFDPSTIVEKRKGQIGGICKVAGINEELGLVFGWAIVSKVKGEDYYDLNIEKVNGQWVRVPEHITEDAVVKGALDFSKTARPGNEMHAGPDTGEYAFVFPWTTEIAKGYGYENPPMTGLMVAYHPAPEVLAKFKDGTYTGFSIEGSRVKSEELA